MFVFATINCLKRDHQITLFWRLLDLFGVFERFYQSRSLFGYPLLCNDAIFEGIWGIERRQKGASSWSDLLQINSFGSPFLFVEVSLKRPLRLIETFKLLSRVNPSRRSIKQPFVQFSFYFKVSFGNYGNYLELTELLDEFWCEVWGSLNLIVD